MQGIGYLDEPGAPGRSSPPLPLSLKSGCLGRWTEDRESSLSCILSACWACPREGRVWFQWHLLIPVLSLTNSLILPSLLTSCLNSGYKGEGFLFPGRGSAPPTPVHTAAVLEKEQGTSCSLALAPGWQHIPTGALGSCRVILGAEHREVMAFCWVGTVAPWLSCQSFTGFR